jgi:hypothetical protein
MDVSTSQKLTNDVAWTNSVYSLHLDISVNFTNPKNNKNPNLKNL